MVDPTKNDGRVSEFAERIINACKRIVRFNLEGYGKLRDVKTWLISLAVFVTFLLISYLIFP